MLELLYKKTRSIFWTNIFCALIILIPFTFISCFREIEYMKKKGMYKITFLKALKCHFESSFEKIQLYKEYKAKLGL